jgi:Holliday junction resolvase
MAVTKVTEKWVKKQVTLKLKEMGAYYFFPVASGFMSSGVPDIVACWKGNFLGIECKANGNRPTALQIKNLVDIEKAGGKSILIDETNVELLELIITGKHRV